MTGDPPYHWQLFFMSPDAVWVPRDGLTGEVVYAYRQDQQSKPALDYYPVDTAEGVDLFLEDFRRYTLHLLDGATSGDALIGMLLRRETAPPGGWGKGQRKNETGLARVVLSIATAYGVRDAYLEQAAAILRAELTESPQRRDRAQELAAREGLSL
ncbi:hypothetical protein [uncultured Cellulomonas sp.]|uniref:hypothetical protein n=1 Tax=uncultured Cellulomonas sp. TaxID=189682 RepID=UPI00261F4D0E|nr:hypothetical protein [uncultured Cellulomonas sp.]